MRNRRALRPWAVAGAAVLTAAVLGVAAIGATAAPPVGHPDGMPSQSSADVTTSENGGWNTTSMGVAGRPYIKSLSVDGVVAIADNTGGSATPVPEAGTTVTAVVAAVNVCNSTQTPACGQCYADPNRAQVSVVYFSGGNPLDLHRDLASDDGTALPDITANSVIDLTLGLRASATANLRWSWLNGEPLYWKVDRAAGTLQVRFRAGSNSPVGADGNPSGGCSQIPVSTCDVTSPTNDFLEASLVLSLDTTMEELFSGALFASKGAYIGSLESSPVQANNLAATTLTYGIAGPHFLAGGATPRRGTFYGLLSNEMLTNAFGVSPAAFSPSEFNIARQAGSTSEGTDSVAWSEWNAADNGTAGQLVTISDISFSAPKFRASRSGSGSSANAAKKRVTVKVGKSRSAALLARDLGLRKPSGGKLTLKVRSSSKKVCAVRGAAIKALRKGTCGYTVTGFTKAKKKAGSKSGTFRVIK